MDRAARIKLTAEPETDCARDCMHAWRRMLLTTSAKQHQEGGGTPGAGQQREDISHLGTLACIIGSRFCKTLKDSSDKDPR